MPQSPRVDEQNNVTGASWSKGGGTGSGVRAALPAQASGIAPRPVPWGGASPRARPGECRELGALGSPTRWWTDAHLAAGGSAALPSAVTKPPNPHHLSSKEREGSTNMRPQGHREDSVQVVAMTCLVLPSGHVNMSGEELEITPDPARHRTQV